MSNYGSEFSRGMDIFPTEQWPSLSVCPSGGEVRRDWRWQWKEQDRQAGAQRQPPSCLEVDCSISISFACTGGVDSDQPEYQRCEAGMTSPRVCLLPEPCQATLPARSQHPPTPTGLDNKLQPATGGVSQRAGWAPAKLRQGTRYLLGISFYQTLRASRWSFSRTLGAGTLWR